MSAEHTPAAKEASTLRIAESLHPGAAIWNRLLAAILIVGILVRVYLMLRAQSTEEDFYITLRYAENIAAGHGFVYNAGQHVLGTTNPLYTLLLAALLKLGISGLVSAKLIGLCADAAAGFFTYRLGKSMGRPGCGLAAALCLALAPVNLTAATRGMEVGLVAAAGIAAWSYWAEEQEAAAWLCAAALAMLRIDGAALAIILLVATVLRRRLQGIKPLRDLLPWRGMLLAAAVSAPWFLFATIYFGSPIPMSLKAKLTVYGRLIPGRFPHLAEFFTLMLHNPFGLAMGVGAGMAVTSLVYTLLKCRGGKKRTVPRETLLAAPLFWIALHYTGMAFSHVVLFGWYFVPPTPVYYLAATTGLALMFAPSAARAIRWTPVSLTTVLAVSAVGMAAFTVPRVQKTLIADQKVETDLRIPIGEYMAKVSRPGETLMLEPIGYIGYYSRMQIIDVIGLISPEALPSYAADVPQPDHDLWMRLHPHWLLLRAGQRKDLLAYEQGLPQSKRLEAEYMQSNTWRDPLHPSAEPVFYLYHRH